MPKVEPQINTVIPNDTMKENLTFLHRSMGSPTTITLLKATGNKNVPTWLFMTESNVRKLLPHSIPAALVHQDITDKMPNLILHIQQPMTENNNWKQLTSTRQSTSQKCHQAKYSPIKLENSPSNQAVGKNVWWSYMHMTPTPFS